MGVGDWYREKENIEREYNSDIINREKYEERTKFAIGMIYKCGDKKDKEAAKRMAAAHGYDINELVKIVK